MTAPLGNSFYNGTNGTAISAANSASSGDACAAPVLNTTTAKFSTTQAWAPSTFGLQLDYTLGGTSAGYVPWNFAPATATTRVAHRFYFYTGATFTTQDFYALRSAAAALMKLSIDATGKIVILNQVNATLATATTALSANTWYRIELAVTVGTTTGNGVIELAYYAGNSLTPIQSFTTITNANLGTVAPAGVRLGTSSAVASVRTQYYGALGIAERASGFIGPNSLTITGTVPVDLALAGVPVASATGTVPIALGLAGAAVANVSGTVPIALGLTGTPVAQATGQVPVALALTGQAVPVVTGQLSLTLGLTGQTGAQAATGSVPLVLGLAGVPTARVTGQAPVTLGLTGQAVPVVTGQMPLVLGLTGSPRSLDTGSAPLSLGVSGSATAIVTGEMPLGVGIDGMTTSVVSGMLLLALGMVATAVGVVSGSLPLELGLVGTTAAPDPGVLRDITVAAKPLPARYARAGLPHRFAATPTPARFAVTEVRQ